MVADQKAPEEQDSYKSGVEWNESLMGEQRRSKAFELPFSTSSYSILTKDDINDWEMGLFGSLPHPWWEKHF